PVRRVNGPDTSTRRNSATPSASPSPSSASALATRESVTCSISASNSPPLRRTSPRSSPPGSTRGVASTVSTEGAPTPNVPSNLLKTTASSLTSLTSSRPLRRHGGPAEGPSLERMTAPQTIKREAGFPTGGRQSVGEAILSDKAPGFMGIYQ